MKGLMTKPWRENVRTWVVVARRGTRLCRLMDLSGVKIAVEEIVRCLVDMAFTIPCVATVNGVERLPLWELEG